MAIYSRHGVRVNLVAAELRTFFTKYRDGRYTGEWVETVPPPPVKPRRVTITYEPIFVWYAQATYAETSKDGSCKPGMVLWEGEFENTSGLVADDGIREIHGECRRLNPADAAREDELFGKAA